ncbi:porin [Microbulbifer hydrolyticus]|uniref:Porin n=1 Tax=Microbulbifer hydrolyticus TaxID=48074 RepID=A0A6P1T8W4_9GAMM|nr:porin [Microbulbifer hydrolyticus]MBB5210252.1 putative porin [Microbulbifer hydrolyticus]QHQ39244.1 porin [Microbulbifer hydrolyticus]
MKINIRKTLLAASIAAAASNANAVPIYQSNQVTLYMEGYFTAHMVNTFGDTQMQDGASRVRIGLNVPAYDLWDTGFNLEWGVRAINSAQNLVIQGDQQAAPGDRRNSLYLRQGHLFAKHPKWGEFSAGKQWGVYYEVTYITDWYNVSGGLASGTYGLNTDGGVTGTGRADSALAWRKTWKLDAGEFKIGLQYAAHVADLEIGVDDIVGPDTLLVCPPGDCEYGISHGIAAVYRADIGDGLFFGAAYNRVKLDIASQDGLIFDTSGLEPVLVQDDFAFNASSNDWTTAIGMYYGKEAYAKGFYGAVVLQRSQNNQLAPIGSVQGVTNFFDARGSESFLSYTWGSDNCYTFYGGHNYLESDDPEFDAALIQGDKYRLEQYFLGFQYRWNERVRIYFENGFDGSNVVAAPEYDSFNAIGIRIDI